MRDSSQNRVLFFNPFLSAKFFKIVVSHSRGEFLDSCSQRVYRMHLTKNSRPLVSIIMPTYNHGKFIREAINSVLNQAYKNFELIIVDNYSDDDTGKIVSSYNEDRIKYSKIRNKGIIAVSRNYGMKRGVGEYIAFLDSDDFWLQSKPETVIDCMREESGIDAVCHDEWLQRERGNKKRSSYGPHDTYRSLLFNGNRISTSATVVRKQKISEVGGFSENTQFVGVEDYDFWL